MKREWRVRWRGEDAGRANTRIYQSEAPARRFALILEGRLAEAFPDTDPDAVACCAGGSMEPFAEGNCNCGGKTKLVEGPDVESRPVGDWELAALPGEGGR